jgi:hypothetical protein
VSKITGFQLNLVKRRGGADLSNPSRRLTTAGRTRGPLDPFALADDRACVDDAIRPVSVNDLWG